MKFDAHKAKASLNWKKKHGVPLRPSSLKPERKQLPSNAFRFEEPSQESSEDMELEDTERLKAMQRANLIQDAGSFTQFEHEKLAIAEVQGDAFTVDFNALEASLMTLPLHELLGVPQEWLNEDCIDWPATPLPSESQDEGAYVNQTGFLDLIPHTNAYDNEIQETGVPDLPLEESSIKVVHSNQENVIQKTKSTRNGESENLEEWLDDLLD